jgi:hypothetical protein
MASVVADATDKDGKPIYMCMVTSVPPTFLLEGTGYQYRSSPGQLVRSGSSGNLSPHRGGKKDFRATCGIMYTAWWTWWWWIFRLMPPSQPLAKQKGILRHYRLPGGIAPGSIHQSALHGFGRNDCSSGNCEKVVKPFWKRNLPNAVSIENANPPLVAHSYERVMPGAKYVASIRDFWRVFSGVNPKSIELCRSFCLTC